jgi:predicted transcriptional regulator of viral defense system
MFAFIYNCVHIYPMTKAQSNRLQQAEKIFRKHGGLLRTTQALTLRIHPRTLYALRDSGRLIQVSRGLYELAEKKMTAHHTLAIACKRVPMGIICLLSALRFHDLTTQAPFEVWMAIDRLRRKPNEQRLALRIFRFSGQALQAGVEKHKVEGIEVRVYNPAKTVVDCFKYRNKIGLEVALEALREGWRERRFTMDDLWRYGKICRVTNVMRPYLEALVS